MKNIIFIILVFLALKGFAQKEKDSLLKVDINKVVEKLDMMHFLDQSTMYFKEVDNFKDYFEEHISGNNDTLKFKIIHFLDLKKPLDNYTFKSYVTIVYDKNAKELINIIKSYGWPSESRINEYVALKRNRSPMIFVMRAKNKDAKKIKRLSKDEVSLGHMGQSIYDMIVWQASPERNNSEYLNKKGYLQGEIKKKND
ncbi:MAG: hypothetical protein R2783_08475 [Gelidibacter sp.]